MHRARPGFWRAQGPTAAPSSTMNRQVSPARKSVPMKRSYICNCLLVLSVLAAIAWCSADAAEAKGHDPAWQPGPPRFAYAVKKDLSVPMDDGVVLSVDEYFPADPTSGARAA